MRLASVAQRPSLTRAFGWRATSAVFVSLGLAAGLTGPAAGQTDADEGVDIVVTYSVLGAVVQDLVGDAADVTVLMENGVDPHDWSPSAQDIEKVYAADLVVTNGLGLEEGLHDTLEEAEASGIRVFEATDHIDVRALGEATHEDEARPTSDDAEDEHAHQHGLEDPHFWVDPVSMIAVVDALAPVIGELGADVTDRQADLVARLTTLDADVKAQLEAIPAEARKMVTGHESMGYFADRYGFELVGAVIPGLSSQGEVSAGELAELAEQIRAEGVSVVFSEIGTPQSVIASIAAETGASVVELPSHNLPADGSYFTFITDIANAVADAIS